MGEVRGTRQAESSDVAVRDLDEVRGILATLLSDPPSPAVERMLQDADVLCHAALWMLGETRGLTAECPAECPDDSGVVPAQRAHRRAEHGAARGSAAR